MSPFLRSAFALALLGCGETQVESKPATAPAVSAATPVAAPAPETRASATPTKTVAFPPAKRATLKLSDPSGGATAATKAAIEQGDDAYEKDDYDAAEKAYRDALIKTPKAAAPRIGVVRVQIARMGLQFDYGAGKGKPEVAKAVSEMRSAAQSASEFGAGQVELGRVLLLAGDADGSISALRKGVSLLPDEAESHSTLGVALLATGKGDEALTELGKAAALDPGSAPRRGNYGTALFFRGRTAEAVEEYEAQVKIADSDPRAHSDLGSALLAVGNRERGAQELRKAIALDPKRPASHVSLAYALLLDGARDASIAEYKEALKLDERYVTAWIGLATALARDPKGRAEARKALLRAQAIDREDPRVKANLEELDALEKSKP